MAARLNRLFHDKNAIEINEVLRTHGMTRAEGLIANTLVRILEQHGDLVGDVFYREGVGNILEQPEYSRIGSEDVRNERVRNVLEVLEQNRLLPALASHMYASPDNGVQVIIGGENAWDEMKDVSLVVARYGQRGKVGGLLGVIGPTRMQYDRAIAVVRYMTNVMNELLAEVYGYDEGEE
jgi:heat-inducible transcriptional repressor